MYKHTLCIFQMCSLEKVVEDYIFPLLNELKKYSEYLLIVCNGEINKSDLERLRISCDDIYIRGDYGFDAGAFADVITKYIPKETLLKYDELILVNDSCYGPIYPLSEMFNFMNQKDTLDFWAITAQNEFKDVYYGINIIPYHVQPYFIVIRKRMFQSTDFFEFWENMIIPSGHMQAVNNYELKFTEYFESKGYKGGAYINNSDLLNYCEQHQPYIYYDTYNLIKEFKCPLIKRKAFKLPHNMTLTANYGETLKRTLNYISENTDYDINIIIRDLLHTLNPTEIRNALHLDFIIHNNANHSIVLNKGICMIVYVYDEESIQRWLRLWKETDFYGDKILIVERNELKKNINENKYKYLFKVFDLLNDYDCFISEIKDRYDYICFINDKIYYDKKNLNKITKKSYTDMLIGCMLDDYSYLCNIIKTFENDDMLGALIPAKAYFSDFFSMPFSFEYNQEWLHILKQFNIKLFKDKKCSLFTPNNTFWIKSHIFVDFLVENKNRLNIEYMKYWGSIIAYYVQSKNLYSGIVMNEEYASIVSSSCQYMLDKFIVDSIEKQSFIERFHDFVRINKKLFYFCNEHNGVYIYGAGDYGHECLKYLKLNNIKFLGFIVSDGYKHTLQNTSESVYEISELVLKNDEGIIIAMVKDLYNEIKDVLKKHNIVSYITYLDINS